ncbi:unnamed protein product [Linum tenue]|uniref:Uncharacterized protein n=1 Tax=Linum tenue TaxID=586396 RepID=A0AAV0ITH5_9ROSI|nr:unnamed protein product [Linum tenue]
MNCTLMWYKLPGSTFIHESQTKPQSHLDGHVPCLSQFLVNSQFRHRVLREFKSGLSSSLLSSQPFLLVEKLPRFQISHHSPHFIECIPSCTCAK